MAYSCGLKRFKKPAQTNISNEDLGNIDPTSPVIVPAPEIEPIIPVPDGLPGTPAPEIIPEPTPIIPIVPDFAPSTEPVATPINRFATFNTLYAQYVVGKENTVASMVFAPNTSVAQAADRIVGDMVISNDNDITDNDVTVPAINELDAVVASFANTISKSVAELQAIHGLVDTMTNRVMVLRDSELASDPLISARTGKTELATEFLQIPWNNTMVLGTESMIINQVHRKHDIKANDTSSNFIELIGRKLTVNHERDGIKTIDLSTEKLSEIETVLINSLPKVQPTTIKYIVSVLTNNKVATLWVNQVYKGALQKNNYSDVSAKFLTDIPAFSQVIDALDKNIVELHSETEAVLSANLEKAVAVLNFMGYVVINDRHHKSANALILQNKMLNPDNYSEYVAKGGTQLEIMHHLTLNKLNSLMPVNGIPAKVISDRVERYRKEISTEAINDNMRVQVATNYATKRAFEHVCNEDIKKYIIEKGLAIDTNNSGIIAIYSNNMIAQNQTISDAIWACIVRIIYFNTFTEVMYTSLGTAYLKALGSNESVTEADKVVIDAGVYADMVINYLLQRFTVISDPPVLPPAVIEAPTVMEEQSPVTEVPAVVEETAVPVIVPEGDVADPVLPIPAGENITT